MATKRTDDEVKKLLAQGHNQYDINNMTDDELSQIAQARNTAKLATKSGGTTDWSAANTLAEKLRSNYGYSMGSSGNAYSALANAAKDTTSYTNKYSDALQSAIDAIQNRAAFSYDYTTDPSYQAYKKEYTREGQRSLADTLGQAAALTGGMASTAAVNAANQAGDYYAAQLSDKIPELYNAAYSMYQDETDDLYDKYNLYKALYDTDYSEYQDRLSQSNYEDETAYNRNQDAMSNARDEIDAYLSAGGSASNIPSDLLTSSGYSSQYVNQLEAYYRTQAAQNSGSGNSNSTFASLLKNIPSADLDKLESFNGDENKVNDYLDSIFYTILGGNIDLKDYLFGRYTDADYSEPVNTTPISESEFNRSSAMVSKYGSYANYLRVFNQ